MQRIGTSFIVFTAATALSVACNVDLSSHERASTTQDAGLNDGGAGDTTDGAASGAYCGNGVVEAGEACDDGNAEPDDGCDTVCELVTTGCCMLACDGGEGICLDTTEESCGCNAAADAGCAAKNGGSSTCEARDGWIPGATCGEELSCELDDGPLCGNGNVDPGEQCDDGNNADGDGCDATCKIEQEEYEGCPTEPTCDDVNELTGEWCIPLCSVECWRLGVSAEFVATSYNIEVTGLDLGMPEHTGGEIRMWYVLADDRSVEPGIFDQPDSCPEQTSNDGGPPFNETTLHPSLDDSNPERICLELRYENGLYNHGRTVADDECSIRQVDETHSPLAPRYEDAEAWTLFLNDYEDFEACVLIPDGFCDAACDECSYVVPDAGIADDEPTGTEWECSSFTPPSYYAAPFDTCNFGLAAAYRLPDPFTHCGNGWGASGAHAVTSEVGGAWPIYSGKWGHNSNTDHDASRVAFASCSWGGGRDWPAAACNTCGGPNPIAAKHVACTTLTNTAMSQANGDNGCDGRACDVNCNSATPACGVDGAIHPTCGATGLSVEGM